MIHTVDIVLLGLITVNLILFLYIHHKYTKYQKTHTNLITIQDVMNFFTLDSDSVCEEIKPKFSYKEIYLSLYIVYIYILWFTVSIHFIVTIAWVVSGASCLESGNHIGMVMNLIQVSSIITQIANFIFISVGLLVFRTKKHI